MNDKDQTSQETSNKHQVVYVLPGAGSGSMDPARKSLTEVFGSHDENITLTLADSYSSNEGLQEQAAIRSDVASPIEKMWKRIIQPVNGLATSLMGYSEEAHLHNARFLFAATEGKSVPETVQRRVDTKEGETETTNETETNDQSASHILVFGHCQGVKGGIVGMINSWYAEALQVQQKRNGAETPGNEPSLGDQLFPETERISLLLLDSPEWNNGNLMSDAKGERIPLSEKLKLIEAMATPRGQEPRKLFDVTIISRRTNESERAKILGRDVTLATYRRDPQLDELINNFPVHHVNMGFRHLTKRRPKEAKAVFLFTKQQAQKALAYRKVEGESDTDKEKRIQEALSGCLVDVAKAKKLAFTPEQKKQPNYPDQYREKALNEALFDIDNCEDFDLYDHMITPNNFHKLVMFQKLGYISDDLMKDVEELIEKRELKILLEYCEGEIQEENKEVREEREDALDLLTFVDPELKDQLKKSYKEKMKELTASGEQLSDQKKLEHVKDIVLRDSHRRPFASRQGRSLSR